MDNMIKNGVIHCHSGNSLNDGSMTPTQLCQRAAELGAPAVTLTDHGIMTGTFEFIGAAKEFGLKGIPGVEAYVQEDDKSSKRMHLLLLPKTYNGYLAICKAVTESYKRLDDGFPRMNLDILKKCFGIESKAHGEVIATSACVGGVLASILLRNEDVKRSIEKLLNKQPRSVAPSDPAYKANVSLLEAKGKEIAALIERREELTPLVSKSFTARERAVDKMDHDSPEYAEAKASLDADKLKKEAYSSELSVLRVTIASEKKKETAIRKQVKDAESQHEKWFAIQKQIDELKSGIAKDEDLYDEAIAAAKSYVEIFGAGNFYVELQYHGLDNEKVSMPTLAKIAKALDLPVVAANDAHMATNSPDDILRRQLIKSLRFNKWEDPTPDAPTYYIKTDDELRKALSMILDNETVDAAMNGVKEIFDVCNVEFPKGLHFPKFRDSEGNIVDAKARLREMCELGIERRFPKKSGWTLEYEKRLDYELGIICGMGYADYLCIVEDYVNEGRRQGKNNPQHVGMGVGVGRGSAAGSLVCYLIGITGVDPIKYGLLFERFLNPERVSMPDIDEDFMVEIRDNVIEYIKSIYGEDAVCNIVTKGSFAGKSAIRAAARILGSKYDDKEEYLALGNRLARMIPETPGATISDAEGFEEEKGEDAIEVIQCAKLIEGSSSSYGMHACGVIIADNGNVGDYVSMMKQGPDDPWMCQCTMVEAEKNAGLLKMDFLGLRNLSIITDTLRLIKQIHGIELDMEKIGASLVNGRTTPYDVHGNVFDDIFAKGKTNGVFQFESPGMKKMLKQFCPTNIDDVILLVAAYRPGPMQYLEGITDVKKGRKVPSYVTPALAPILDKTYGYTIYQEQVMQIFNQVAGFSMGQADEVRRAMGKKHIEILLDPKTNFKGRFIDGLIAAGATEEASERFWDELLDFASYAFNKSHAAAYAFTAFYTAWLKLNYPLEYMKALLNYTTLDKIPMVISECLEMGIEVLPPDINKSGEGFEVSDGKILFGLSSVKGVAGGAKLIIEERAKNGAFRDIKDFVVRSPLDKGSVAAVIGAGALDAFGPNRAAMIEAYDSMSETYAKIVKKREDVKAVKAELLSALQEKHPEIMDLPDTDTLYSFASDKVIKKARVTQYVNHISRLKALENIFHDACVPSDEVVESKMARLEREKELIGMYVSGHPLDSYEGVKSKRTCPICDADSSLGKVIFCGRIEDVRYAKRKSDGKDMAFFDLTDETGSIPVCCFTAAYEEFGEFVAPGNFVAIAGRIENDASPDDEEEHLKLYASRIAPLRKKMETVMLSLPTVADWQEALSEIEKYKGNDLILYFREICSGEIRKCTFTVSESILNSQEIFVKKIGDSAK